MHNIDNSRCKKIFALLALQIYCGGQSKAKGGAVVRKCLKYSPSWLSWNFLVIFTRTQSEGLTSARTTLPLYILGRPLYLFAYRGRNHRSKNSLFTGLCNIKIDILLRLVKAFILQYMYVQEYRVLAPEKNIEAVCSMCIYIWAYMSLFPLCRYESIYFFNPLNSPSSSFCEREV